MNSQATSRDLFEKLMADEDRVFCKRPRDYTADENCSGGAYFEWRDH
jgi:hypothetical protein